MFENASCFSGPLSSLHIRTKVGLSIADLLPGSLLAAADGLFSSLLLPLSFFFFFLMWPYFANSFWAVTAKPWYDVLSLTLGTVDS